MEGELQQDLCFDSLERKPELPLKLHFPEFIMELDVLWKLSCDKFHQMTRRFHKEHERLVSEGERLSERLLKEEIKELVKNDKAIRYLDPEFAAQLYGLEIPSSLNASAESSSLHDEPLASETSWEIHPICFKEGKEHKGRKGMILRRQMDDYESGIPANEAAVDYDDSSSFSFLMSLILSVSSAVLCLLPLLSTNKRFTENLHFAKAGPLNSMRMSAGALMMAAITSLLALDALPRRSTFARRSGFVAVLSSLFGLLLFLPAFFLGAMFPLI